MEAAEVFADETTCAHRHVKANLPLCNSFYMVLPQTSVATQSQDPNLCGHWLAKAASLEILVIFACQLLSFAPRAAAAACSAFPAETYNADSNLCCQ